MKIKKKLWLEVVSLFLIAIIFAFSLIIFNTGFLFKTADGTLDQKSLSGIEPAGQVLGARETKLICPLETPIIGWINLDGKKMIVQNLDRNLEPSSCFATELEATQNGYFK